MKKWLIIGGLVLLLAIVIYFTVIKKKADTIAKESNPVIDGGVPPVVQTSSSDPSAMWSKVETIGVTGDRLTNLKRWHFNAKLDKANGGWGWVTDEKKKQAAGLNMSIDEIILLDVAYQLSNNADVVAQAGAAKIATSEYDKMVDMFKFKL